MWLSKISKFACGQFVDTGDNEKTQYFKFNWMTDQTLQPPEMIDT